MLMAVWVLHDPCTARKYENVKEVSMKMAFLAVALLASFNAVAAKPVAFPATAKVSVDANGKLVAIDVLTDLPPPVEAFIKKRIASWTFSPPKRGDVTGAGVTYLSLGACALPVDEGGYRLAVDFKHNGPNPRITFRTGPGYPATDMRLKRGAELVAELLVKSDGRASLEAIRYLEGRNYGPASFDVSIRDWVRTLHFDPEQLGGNPVSTRVEVSVSFIGDRTSDLRSQMSKQVASSRECKLASSDPDVMDQVVLDSPIKVKPAG